VKLLWVRGFYDLDSLDLEVKTTIDAALQNEAIQLFNNLKSPEFLRAEGLRQERFLSQGHPSK
jgi:membrane peptidoglycan carboxypeptidase